ncbi:MAG: biotin--[acetyl-CoA-carboxylase] ligase [Acetobacteraceae bacterium]
MSKIKWRLRIYESLSSTLAFCKEQAEAGAAEGLAVMARRQTAGRGTKGRVWVAPPGNLSFSLLLRPADVVSCLKTLPFLAPIAVYEAIQALLPTTELTLKWPNDILLRGDKVSGILIESSPASEGWIVVGIGVNIRSAPEMPSRHLACLAQLGLSPAPEVLAKMIMNHLSAGLAAFASSGADFVRDAWLSRAHKIGTRLAVMTGDDYTKGLFHGLGPEGQLLLLTEGNKVKSFLSGETSMMLQVRDAPCH